MIEHFLPFPSICQKAAVTYCFSIFADIFFIKHICLWSKDAYSYFLQPTAGWETAKRKGENETIHPSITLKHLDLPVVRAGCLLFYFLILCLSLPWFCSLPPGSPPPLSLFLPLFFLLLLFIFNFILSVFIFMKNLHLHSSGRRGNPQRILFLCCRWRWPSELAFDGRVDTLCYLETLRMTPGSLDRLSGCGHLVGKRRAPGQESTYTDDSALQLQGSWFLFFFPSFEKEANM